jgi:conjugative relaxase-like TrwC/TraI family protein
MLTISRALSAGKALEYHKSEYSNSKQNYFSEEASIRGVWHGKLAEEWGLKGEVDLEQFARLLDGQHPLTGEQLVKHQSVRTYQKTDGKMIETMSHRAAFDLTFSMPKTASLAGLVGGDTRILAAHRECTNLALERIQPFVQARIGGNAPPETTGKWIVAQFQHDSARPVDGYSAPQIHTHCVLMNITVDKYEMAHALQPLELFRAKTFATAVYRAELAIRLKDLGYEIERGPGNAPEIKGFTPEYVQASSPRRQQILTHMEEHGVSGPKAAQIAAYQTREDKVPYSKEEARIKHLEMANQFGNQPSAIVDRALQAEKVVYSEERSSARTGKALEYAVNRNTERSAVVDERRILADVLRHGMGEVRTDDAIAFVEKAIDSGDLISIPGRATDVARNVTTPEMRRLEASILQKWKMGTGQANQLAPAERVERILADVEVLNDNQRDAVRQILGSRDQIFAMEGAAGTGKTTVLRQVQLAASESGFEVRGLAPTSRAAINLASSDICAMTLARHLAEAERSSDKGDRKRLYIIDESSMVSTRDMHALLQDLRPSERVLLVGDTRQHESIGAGRIYAQLREAGIGTAELREIVRQKDEALKAVVRDFADRKVASAVYSLMAMGRVHEYPDRDDRYREIAHQFAQQDRTLVIAPDNASRLLIANTVREELRQLGKVGNDEYLIPIKVQRQNITAEDRFWAASYEPGDALRFTRGNATINVAAREMVSVVSVDHDKNLITIRKQNAEEITYNPRSISGVTVYRDEERLFSIGDRIQFTAPVHELKVGNRELGSIIGINDDGDLNLRMDSGRSLTLNTARHPHLDYGYAMTSHSSQGETVDCVFIEVDSENAQKALINNRMAYVAVSRAKFDVHIFTDDANALAFELSRDVSQTMALQRDEIAAVIQASKGVSHGISFGAER